jgi:hypothetical protein
MKSTITAAMIAKIAQISFMSARGFTAPAGARCQIARMSCPRNAAAVTSGNREKRL